MPDLPLVYYEARQTALRHSVPSLGLTPKPSMADSPQSASRASRFKRNASRFLQNTLPQGDCPDELMEQLRHDPANQALSDACFYAVLAKATKEAIRRTSGTTHLPGLTVELANGDLVREIAMKVTIETIDALKQGLHRNGGYVATGVKIELKKCREKAANRVRIEQEKWLPSQPDSTRVSEFDSSDYDALRDQISQLPGQVRSAVTLHFLDGLRLADVADQLGVSVATAHRLKERGVTLLRAAMVG